MKISELLTDESKWCQFYSALSDKPQCVEPTSIDACRWCIHGAIWACYEPGQRYAVEAKLIERIYGTGPRKLGKCLSVWNDAPQRTFEDVRKLVVECNV